MAKDRRNRYGMKKGTAEQLQQLRTKEDEKPTSKEQEHDRIRSLIEGVMNDLNEMENLVDTPQPTHCE